MESASAKSYSEEANLGISKTSLCRDSIINSIKAELALTSKDLHLHETLLRRYIIINEVENAFNHAYNVEFRDKIFSNDLNWYNIVYEILKRDISYTNDKANLWLYQLLLLTVTERICSLNLAKFKSNTSSVFTELTEFLHAYDQAIYKVISLGPSLGLEMFHTALLEHHKAQIALYSAIILLIRVQQEEETYDLTYENIAKLMLVAWQSVPPNLKRNWLRHAAEEQVLAVNRWYTEGTYRCSQAGHYCLYLSKLSHKPLSNCTKRVELLHIELFFNNYTDDIETSYLWHGIIVPHSHILPNRFEVEAYDKDAQKEYQHSLHHILWTLLKYEKMADFECTLFDMLNFSSMDSEHVLNKLDIYAFLYCATLTARNNGSDNNTLPAIITSILCSDVQAKWWKSAYEYYTNKVGSDLIAIDATFAYGIKVIRCIGNKKLDPELLYNLGHIFSDRVEKSMDVKEIQQLKERASLYYQTALLCLQKLINTSVENVTQYRDIEMFNYVCKDMDDIKIKHLLNECKIGIIKNSLTYGEYQTFYNLADTYKRNALIFNDLKLKDKATTSLLEAKTFALKALKKLLEQETNINYLFCSEIQELIQEIEMDFKSFEINSAYLMNTKYSENESIPANNSNLVTDANLNWSEKKSKLIKLNIVSQFNLLESVTNQMKDKIIMYKNMAEDIQCIETQIKELKVTLFKNSSLGQIYVDRNPLSLASSSTSFIMPSFSVGTPPITAATTRNSFSVNLTNIEKKSVKKANIFLGNEIGNTVNQTSLSKPTNGSDLVSNKNSALPLESQSILNDNSLMPTSKISSNIELDNEVSEVKKPLEVTNTVNVCGLNFKCNTSSSSSKIFNITPSANTSTSIDIRTPNNITQNIPSNPLGSDKLNSSDSVEEFERNVDFKPVIPLPPLIDQKSGEEDENVLFEHRARLFRFDTASKEWKECGLGNIKLLVHKDNIQKVRLLMRREQIMEVCCNLTITKDMIFQKMHNEENAVTWCAKDFSESKLIAETLCLRFKTTLLCDRFIEAVKAAQTKIKDESKSTEENENTAKQTAQTDTVNSKPTNLRKDDSDDVILVNEIQATQEEKLKVSKLMLPENCFTYRKKASVLAPPIPSSVNSLNNFSFGIFQSKSVFSDNPFMSTTNKICILSNKSVFDNKTDSQNSEVKSLFLDYGKSENPLTSVDKGNIFEPGALTNNQPKLGANTFGSGAVGGVSEIGPISSQNKAFESMNSLFSTSSQASTFVVASNAEKSKEASSDNNTKEQNSTKTDTVLFSIDNSTSLAALSSISDPAFDKSKKFSENPDFKWEGAGEQSFVAKKQSGPDDDKSDNDSGAVEEEKANDFAPPLPKHLQDSARADNAMSSEFVQRTLSATIPTTAPNTFTGAAAAAPTEVISTITKIEVSSDAACLVATEVRKEVHILEEEPEVYKEQEATKKEDNDAYNNEDEESVLLACHGEAVIRQGNEETTCRFAHIQVLFDQDISSPKVLITDSGTGLVMADMVIHTDTEFQVTGDTCVWSDKDFANNVPVDKTVTLKFLDNDTALKFYACCKTSKATAQSSSDSAS